MPSTSAARNLVLLALLLMVGCSGEEESRVGYGLLPPSVREGGDIQDTTFVGAVADTDYQFTFQAAPGGASTILVLADDEVYRSHALVRFGQLPVRGTKLRSAEIVLSVFRSEPPDRLPRVLAYELVQGFTESLTGDVPFPAFLPDPVAEADRIPAAGDTAATYRFRGAGVDSLFQRWIEGTVDSGRVNAGVMFVMAAGESGRVEFTSRDAALLRPAEIPRAELVIEEEAVLDTVPYYPTRDTFLAELPGASLADEAGFLTVGSAVPVRALLRFGVLPTLDKSLVHRAILTLSVDSTSSHFDSLSVLAELVNDSLWVEDLEETTVRTDRQARAVVTAGSDTVSWEITSIVREWVKGESDNRGVRLRLAAEGEGLDWIRFHSSEAAGLLRPRLEVISSRVPGASE